VYEGLAVDYRGVDVNAQNFLAVVSAAEHSDAVAGVVHRRSLVGMAMAE
jgi:hypothetical protein